MATKKRREKPLPADWSKIPVIDLGTHSLTAIVDLAEANKPHLVNTEIFGRYRQLATEGDPAALARFIEQRSTIQVAAPNVANLEHSTCGSFVDIGRYVSGEPECMIDFISYQPTKFLTIDMGFGFPSGVYPGATPKYYGFVLDCIDKLELSGTRCAINFVMDMYNPFRGDRVKLRIPFKSFDQPLNLALFAGVVLNMDFIGAPCFAFPKLVESYPMDRNKTTFNQTDSQVYFPSIWFNNFWIRPNIFSPDGLLRLIGLSHLITD